MKFNVGDLVYVPNAFSGIWVPYLTVVEEVGEKGYYCKALAHNYASSGNGTERRKYFYEEKEVFADDAKEECAEYIRMYYYSGYCDGCKYDKISGTIWHCSDCEHSKVEVSPTNKYFNVNKCDRTGIVVGGSYSRGLGSCKHFSPTLPQHKEAYQSWEYYDDILRNCEFNTECPGHKYSAIKTCPYERYMNQLVRFPLAIEYYGEKVEYGMVKRSTWMENDFIDKENRKVTVSGLCFAPLYTPKGMLKKGTANRTVTFEEPRTFDY